MMLSELRAVLHKCPKSLEIGVKRGRNPFGFTSDSDFICFSCWKEKLRAIFNIGSLLSRLSIISKETKG